jgi:membrane protease YdiL (CAAX protease family)
MNWGTAPIAVATRPFTSVTLGSCLAPILSCTFGSKACLKIPVSTPENHIPEIPLAPAAPTPLAPTASPSRGENPPWNLWDIAGLTILTILAMTGSLLGGAYFVHRHFAPATPWMELTKRHDVLVGAQFVTYLVILLVMYSMVDTQSKGKAWEAIRWNWPKNWVTYVGAGLALQVCLLLLASALPMPKHAPIDEFFRTARDAWIVSLFGVLFAPVFEEVYFRGFLYPALARRLGPAVSIVITSLLFAAIHGPQLSEAWGPVLVIFLVGIALTTVRAVKKSVAATVLMHMAYNGTIFIAAYVSTDGFRHLEKINQ